MGVSVNRRFFKCIGGLWATLFLCGCLSSDPALVRQDRSERSTVLEKEKKDTRAPKEIDPQVLASRAFHEAPILAERVRGGDLPPVSERLPENPLVVVPLEEIGTYGGDIRRALTGDIVQVAAISKTMNENLMGYERPLPKSIELNLAESYTFEDGGKTAFFKIRKGIRWSDGVPFTVDDILFWYQDMTLDDNARDSSSPPSIWLVDGEPMVMAKVDDHTLRVSSIKPMGRLLDAFCSGRIAYPRHVYEQYHPRYNPQATYEGFRDSTTSAKLIMKPGVPRLTAWVPVVWERGQRIIYERNPYYWKVDTAGNQLPYADRLIFNVIPNVQVIVLKFVNGEIDLFGRYSQVEMFPTLKVEEKKGNFKIRVTGPERGPALYLNWDCPKPNVRKAFRDKRVRIALSHAIHREEINQIIYHGLLDASGYSFSRHNVHFSETAYQTYAAYDPDKARSLLDAAGYRDMDGDGFREFADGTRFEINIDTIPGVRVKVCELVAAHWQAVGIKVNLNISLRDIIFPRRLNGEFDVHSWRFAAPADPLGKAEIWGIMSETSPFWHRNATVDAPDWLREATDLIKKAMTTVKKEEVKSYMIRLRDLHTENVPIINIGFPYHVWGASTRLGNVPYENTLASIHRGWSRPIFHEQIFVRP
jgi:peptide/nickel transport system substrate-binding protein